MPFGCWDLGRRGGRGDHGFRFRFRGRGDRFARFGGLDAGLRYGRIRRMARPAPLLHLGERDYEQREWFFGIDADASKLVGNSLGIGHRRGIQHDFDRQVVCPTAIHGNHDDIRFAGRLADFDRR